MARPELLISIVKLNNGFIVRINDYTEDDNYDVAMRDNTEEYIAPTIVEALRLAKQALDERHSGFGVTPWVGER
jgi:hypothetical protein